MPSRSSFISFVLTLLLLCVAAISVGQWFQGIEKVSLDPDEVVWVLDAQFGQWYAEGEWDRFRLSSELSDLAWYEHQYRVIDQPQLGKYLHGWLLLINNLNPWHDNKLDLYIRFSTSRLPGGPVNELESQLGSELVKSIILLRYTNATISVVGFLLIAWLFFRVTKTPSLAVILFLLLIKHPLLLHYYRLAIVNPYSLLFQVLTVLMMMVSFSHMSEKISWKKRVFQGGLTGILLALAVSVKLDGVFLFFAPVMLGLWWQVQYFLEKNRTAKKAIEINIHQWVWWMVGFLVAGAITFFVLEPELWFNPVEGTYQLLASRIIQQERFAIFFNDLNWVDRLVKLSDALGMIKPQQSWLVNVLLGFGIGAWAAHLVKTRRVKNYSFQVILTLTLLAVLLGSLYCFRVGFDRYIIPAVIVLYTLASMGYAVFLSPLPIPTEE